jgi:hypothetical protein
MKTEINIYVLIAMLLIHWIADFILQTDKQAKGKSTSNLQLTMHVTTYTLVWALFGIILGIAFKFYLGYSIFDRIAVFCVATFVCHWITDYITSRLNTHLHKKGDIHNFFVSVGFDQILHYVQLILTLQLLS